MIPDTGEVGLPLAIKMLHMDKNNHTFSLVNSENINCYTAKQLVIQFIHLFS